MSDDSLVGVVGSLVPFSTEPETENTTKYFILKNYNEKDKKKNLKRTITIGFICIPAQSSSSLGI